MRVGYIAPMSISIVHGGLRTQALQTIKHVRNYGVEPVMTSPWENVDTRELDLVHIFGASVENSGFTEQCAHHKIPMILSPVFYANRSPKMIRTALYMENITSYLGDGIRSDFSIKARMCRLADTILPNTLAEANLIEQGFSIDSGKITVVPNGVEARFKDAGPKLFIDTYGISDFVLFAGQADAPRKNVMLLLQAAAKIEHQIVIIGSFGTNNYGKKCTELAHKLPNVILIDPLPHDSELLASAYAASKVFVLPSQFETPGIAAMEAALTGSNIVITKEGGTQDYFGEHAEYIDPKSITSLVNGLKASLTKKEQTKLKEHILGRFSWDMIAQKTVKAYQGLL